MRPAPQWRPGRRADGAYRGRMVQCPQCGYATWRAPACAFCGAPLEVAAAGTADGPIPQAAAQASAVAGPVAGGLSTLFLVWFLAGLLLGIVGFSPRARAAGALLWPRADRPQPTAIQAPALKPPAPMAPRAAAQGSPAPTR